MKTLIGLGAAALVVLVLLFSCFRIVPPGSRGIDVRLGSVNGVYDQGLHFKLPFIEKIVLVSVQTQKDQVDASAASKDLQDVQTTVAVTDRIDPAHVADVYQRVGYGNGILTDTIVIPAIQESLKAATAQFTAEELVTKRELVKEKMKQALAERLAENFVLVDDVSIVNFKFSDVFERSIEAKVAAEQDALAAQNKLAQVKFEAQQKIETAKADAESIKIQAEALAQNQELVKLKAVEKWDGKLPTYMMGTATPFIDLAK
jgi:regulator of protease activity HflC (stomatin/prohibitin superfamily)